MLGETLADPEGTESGRSQTVRGLGLLPIQAVFTDAKHRTQDTATVTAPQLAGAVLTGYQIHTGRTAIRRALLPPCRRQHRGLRKGQRGGHLSARPV